MADFNISTMNGHNSPPIQITGMHIDLTDWPGQNWLPHTLKDTPDKDQATHHLIQSMLDKNVIQETTLNEGNFPQMETQGVLLNDP